jgi:hypothetical protein
MDIMALYIIVFVLAVQCLSTVNSNQCYLNPRCECSNNPKFVDCSNAGFTIKPVLRGSKVIITLDLRGNDIKSLNISMLKMPHLKLVNLNNQLHGDCVNVSVYDRNDKDTEQQSDVIIVGNCIQVGVCVCILI